MSDKGYENYIDAVKNGKVIVGNYIKQAVIRFEAMRARDDIVFDPKKVDRVIKFFRLLRHFKGKHAGKPFVLAPWQEFACAAIYGLYYKDGGRVCRNAYIEVARKNGKTAFGAGLALYGLIGDGERGAEVDLAANSKDQAKIAFEFCQKFARSFNEDERKPLIKSNRDSLIFGKSDSKMNVFASDAATLDGYDASMYLLDEYHAAPDSELRDVLQSSQASRTNPLGIIITTAGFDLNSPCYNYRTTCVDVLSGVATDDSLFALIYSLDDEDDWKDPAVWGKCAPNMGEIANMRFYRDAVKQAENDTTAEVGIRTKTFNQWLGSKDLWVPDKYLLQAVHKLELSDVVDLDTYVCGGIDLASTSDLTASATMAIKDGIYYFWVDYYLPTDANIGEVESKRYKSWERQGYINRTPGNVTDYNYILKRLLEDDQVCNYQKIGYDPYNSTQFVIKAEDHGLPMRPYSQTIGNFNKPTKELERLLLSGKCKFAYNPVTLFCFRNVVLRLDHNGNVKPDKSKASSKIDGVIAMIEALGCYLDNPVRDVGI